MNSRIKSLDTARGFTVFIMPAVHTVMLYSNEAVRQSWPGMLLGFLAEGPGAQLFMLLMGASVVMARPKKIWQVLRRSLILFFAGYLLNLLRMVIPAGLNILPPELIEPYLVYKKEPDFVSLLLTGDILQTAGISYMVIWLLYQYQQALNAGIFLFFVIILSSVLLRDLHASNTPVDHLAGLLTAGDYRAFFPLIPWLCYPIAGMCAAIYVRGMTAPAMHQQAAFGGLLLLAGGIIIHVISPATWDQDFYRAGPGRSIYQTGFVLLWIWFAWLFTQHFENGLFCRLLHFCSRNITIIYFLQWVLIAWATCIAGYHQLAMVGSLVAVVITTSVTIGGVYLLQRVKNWRSEASSTLRASSPEGEGGNKLFIVK